MWFSFAPTKVPQVLFATNLLIRNSIIAMAADMEEVLIADMQHWRDALRISFIRTVGSKYLLNKKYLPLLVLLTDKLNTLGWILSLTFMVQSRIWTSLSLLPSLAIRPWCLLPAQNQVLWPRERRRPSSTGTHTSILSRSFLRQLADLAHMPGNSLIICCEMLITHQLLSETLGPPSRVFSTVPSPNNNSWQPLRDSVGSTFSPSRYIHKVFMLASTGYPGLHTAYFSLKNAAAVPCGPAVTSPHPTMTSTTLTAISSSCLRTLALCPLCLRV